LFKIHPSLFALVLGIAFAEMLVQLWDVYFSVNEGFCVFAKALLVFTLSLFLVFTSFKRIKMNKAV
jgi:hypothetical protein